MFNFFFQKDIFCVVVVFLKDCFGVDFYNFLLFVQMFLEDDRYVYVMNEMYVELIVFVLEKIMFQYDVLVRDMVLMVSVFVFIGFKIMIFFMCLNIYVFFLYF